MLKRGIWAVAALAALLGAAVASEEAPLGVCVSIPPQAWLVKRLAGDAVAVETLLMAGANPHTYEPTARQVRRLAEAAVFFRVGMPFEAPLAARAAKLNPGLAVASMDKGIVKRGAHAHDHGAHDHVCAADGDPHIWLSARLMAVMASNTAEVLSGRLPGRAAEVARRLEETVAEIGATDAAVRGRLRGVAGRTWVVYHPSWGYFAEEYGLSLLVIEQDGKAPSARHLARVIGAARAAGVRVVFTEPQYDRRPAETLARQVGARLEVIDPLAEAWPELMREVADRLAGRMPPERRGE